MKPQIVFFLFALLVMLVGCQTPTSRYPIAKDSAPLLPYAEPSMHDVQPRFEPYREINKKAYKINGITYTPLHTGKGYTEEGGASWYGQKFHGHLTANGEVYDMFAMTAAHRTLPLPSFVKVTNLETGTVAVVRVNDRGPFHSDRIIDLSYAAAKKLGFQQKGTAKVRLETIYVDEQQWVSVGDNAPIPYADYLAQSSPSAATAPNNLPTPLFIQVAALADGERAQQLSRLLSELYQVPAEIPKVENLYRLRLGPFEDTSLITELLNTLRENGYPHAYTITSSM